MKGGILFAAGSLMGAAAGVVSTYFVMKKRYEERFEAEIAAFKAEYKGGRHFPHFEELEGGEINPVDEDAEKGNDISSKSSIDDGPVVTDKIAYHKMAENYRKGDVEMESEEYVGPGDDAASTDDPVADGDISVITVEQFEDDNHHEKTSLIYFTENNVLCNEFNEEIEDRELLVGDILEGLSPKEEGLIYIRNNKAYVDYEIDVVNDTWEPEE